MSTPEEIAAEAKTIREKHRQPEEAGPPSQGGMVLRIAIELIAAVTTGGVIGWFIDKALGSSPVFLLICLLLGIAAGYVTIRRVNDAFTAQLEKSEADANEMLDK